jgi:hypothetical protein
MSDQQSFMLYRILSHPSPQHRYGFTTEQPETPWNRTPSPHQDQMHRALSSWGCSDTSEGPQGSQGSPAAPLCWADRDTSGSELWGGRSLSLSVRPWSYRSCKQHEGGEGDPGPRWGGLGFQCSCVVSMRTKVCRELAQGLCPAVSHLIIFQRSQGFLHSLTLFFV